MKMSLCVTSGISLALSLSAVALGQHYTQVNLVSNTSGVAPVTDPTLINPWGLSRSSSSPWWISDNGTPTGTIFNSVPTDFVLPGGFCLQLSLRYSRRRNCRVEP